MVCKFFEHTKSASVPVERILKKINYVSAVFRRWDQVFFLAVCAVLMFCDGSVSVLADINSSSSEMVATALTNTLQLRQLASGEESLSCFVRIEGIVLWVSPAHDRLILQDDSGGVAFRIDLRKEPLPKPGQRVLIEGTCQAGRGEIGSSLVVDNDGVHSPFEKSGSVFLSAGLHPICVEYFNAC